MTSTTYHSLLRILTKKERKLGQINFLEEKISIEKQDYFRKFANIYGTVSVVGTLSSVLLGVVGLSSFMDSFWEGIFFASSSLFIYSLSHYAADRAIEFEFRGCKLYDFHQNL